MFRQAAERFGDRPAIEWEGLQVSYRQLESQAARLARSLREAGAERGSLVAILANRTADVIAAMLAVLDTGCAFVPIDLLFPAATLPAVVAEARPRFWLVGVGQLETLESLRREHGFDAMVLPIAEDWPGDSAGGLRMAPPAEPGDPDAISYVYFTSGSTGRPKGIAGRLQAIDHFIRWEVETFGVGEGTRVSQLTSPAFDAFLRDAFTPLAAGGTVCVPASRDSLLDGSRLVEWIERQRVELLHCTPSLFRLILAQELTPESFPALRWVLLAGEPLLPSDVRRWHSLFAERIRLVNLYGPSETTMVKLFHLVRPEDGHARMVPVGKPMPGVRAIVVDEKGKPCPPGKLGEIYIRTPYRSLGYLNRPDRTAEVFVQNPFSDRPGDVVYKTGDLGRLQEDGTFELVGRRDTQVKVRGVRVEIAPVEDLLRAHESVADVAVVDRTDTQGNKFLCAYVVPRGELDPAALAGELRTKFPDAAIPSAFVTMETLPRTLSGKVDRRALPNPGASRREFVAPRIPVEETLCGIFSELLGIPQIGIRDHFFELGGHSLLATMLLSRIRSTLAVEVPLREVFRAPTVEGLALVVVQQASHSRDPREEVVAQPLGTGIFPLSFPQQRLWLVDQMEPGSRFYNISSAVRLLGPLRVDLLRRAADEIVRRHESLRTIFKDVEGEPRQVIQPPQPAELPLIDLTGVPGREQAADRLVQEEAHGSCDLSRGPLSRGRLVRLAEGEHLLVWVMHHIVADWWSLELLIRELTTLYDAFGRSESSPLPDLPVQYRDFAVWQRQQLQGEALDELCSYWLRRLAGAPPLLRLATDRSRPARQSFRGALLSASFPSELGARVERLADLEGCTVFMMLLGAFAVLLRHSSGQDDLVVGAPFGARQRAEVEGLIGFFVNALPLRIDLSGDPTFRELLAKVRQRVLEALGHQNMPFEKLVEELQPERDLGFNPLFQVTFNLIEGDLAQPLAMSGLEVATYPLTGELTQFDLSLTVFRHGPDLLATFRYSSDLFDALTVAWMGEDLRQVLDEVTAEPEIPLSRLATALATAETARRAALAEEVGRAQRESFGLRRRHAVTILEGARDE
jgi:amino acid adenylation domain-containing protein